MINGVDIEKFGVRGVRKHVRNYWGFSKDHFVVGVVANFRKVKNHLCLVRAAFKLKDAHPNLRLFFVGTGFPEDPENSENEVRNSIHDYVLQDKVIFAGYQNNIPDILSAFDVFCLPSVSEGMPISILEAMSAEVPIIGSYVRGIKEIVHNKKTGLLFLPDDDSDLACALEKLLSDQSLAQTLAKQAYTYVAKEHSKQIWIQKTLNVFLPNQ